MATTQEPNVSTERGTRVLTPPPRTRPTTPADQEADTVQVWPHLVVIEFLGAVIITINLVLLGTLINGPLETLANPDCTPNPSKAPWYFLNLQELLLHMNAALAGVIVPTIALVLIAAIPYVDRGSKGLGVWFYNARGPRIVIFSTIYTIAVTMSLIFFDQPNGKLKSIVSDLLQTPQTNDAHTTGALSFVTQTLAGPSDSAQAELIGTLQEAIAGWVIPIIIMLFFTVLLVFLLKRIFAGIVLTEIIIGLFTGFVILYTVLTFVGTAMRGPGMVLFPPWAVPPYIKC
jgi:menaquinol-cytochrome c reductase cytochrome b/c subunit